DIRSRCEVTLIGTPLTHKCFLRRHHGSYGPAIRAGKQLFPGATTPLPGLFCCGDSTFPGIGLPAVAASGTIAANTLVSVEKHLQMLQAIAIK
ncbi:MAG: carotene isomerase, partial [Xenococcaceae cyanobacterium]